MRYLGRWQPGKRAVALCFVFVCLALGAATVALADSSANIVQNPGFESPLGGTQIGGCVGPSVGNWLAYSQSGFLPTIASSPVHSGSFSGHVQLPAGATTTIFSQDFPAFDTSTSNTISAWIYPQTPTDPDLLGSSERIEFLLGGSRGCGPEGGGGINFDSTETTWSDMWNSNDGSNPLPPVTPGMWHHVVLQENATTLTSTLFIDGVNEGTIGPGTPACFTSCGTTQGDLTLWLGQVGPTPNGSDYFFDDVSVKLGAPCPSGQKVNARWHYSANRSSGSWSATKSTSCQDGSVSIGPQAMEGDLKVAPGTTLTVGYDFNLPGNNSVFTADVSNASVIFHAACASGAAPSASTFTVLMPDQSYAVSDSSWNPSGDQSSPLVYQGSISVPNLCNGGLVRLIQGGTFTGTVLLG